MIHFWSRKIVMLGVAAAALTHCGKKSDDDKKNATVGKKITSAEDAGKALPRPDMLALDLPLNPSGVTLNADDSSCATWGDSLMATACNVSTSIESISGTISEFIASISSETPVEVDGGWQFTRTITLDSATDEEKELFLTTPCWNNDEISIQSEQIVLRALIKQKDDNSVDISLGGGATEDGIIDDIISGNWLQAADSDVLGKGWIKLDAGKTAEIDEALFKAAGTSTASLCGEEDPNAGGTLTLNVNTLDTPSTVSLAIDSDFGEASMAGQEFKFIFHNEQETEFTLGFKANLFGSGDDVDTIFSNPGEKDETINFHMGIYSTDSDFKVASVFSASDGDRADESVTMKACGKWNGTEVEEGYHNFTSPQSLADSITAALEADPSNADLQVFKPEAAEEFCPTFTAITL